MLVLSRHRDETIMIGDDVEITVVDIRGDKVRLGIRLRHVSRSIAKRCTRRSKQKISVRQCWIMLHSSDLAHRVVCHQARQRL